ncbi:esterase/lipase family protein [Qipengyuania nanhaisediminis]|uniref:esterase/lipase family protein n=1 Tax=Qipengyuania nanhaisediminis TaxID=604088 RepID=UPI0038B305DD
MASIAPDAGQLRADSNSTSGSRGPSRIWTLAEGGRAMTELGAFFLSRPLLASNLPRGDGHPVICLPGFMATNNSTRPMRGLLGDLGYDAHGWESGRNVRVDNALVARLQDQLARTHEESGRKVSLIGWSLGGVLARELAKLHPEKVRLVISLGSPITNDRGVSNARRLFEWLNGKEPEPMRDGRFQALDQAPPVPTTSIFTKTDGVVHWHGSVQCGSREDCENIRVRASHCGLGVNPSVMVAIADRLAQDEGAWKPFEPQQGQAWMFPRFSVN